MVMDPEILFCDEPGAGLDPVTAAEIDALLLTLNRELGITIAIITHELLSIERLDGRLIMLGPRPSGIYRHGRRGQARGSPGRPLFLLSVRLVCMKTIIIAALSENRVIGRNNAIPWHYPADMKHFRRVTRGHAVVAGRKTYETFQTRPLPQRRNFVLTRNRDYAVAEGAVVCASLGEVLQSAPAPSAAKNSSCLGVRKSMRRPCPWPTK